MPEDRKVKYFIYLLFLVLPLRESFALMIGESTPMRFGEILMSICPILYYVYRDEYECKNNSISNVLFVFLLYSFIVGVFFAEHIQYSFAVKYFIRGFLFLFLIRIAENKYITIPDNYFVLLFKYTVVIELVFCVMQIMGITLLFGKLLPYEASVTFGFKRLSGTASEPGYLIPIITPCIYFFISDFKKYRIWAILSFTIAILSLSSFGYVAVIVVLLMKLIMSHSYSIIRNILVYGCSIIFSLFALSKVFPQISDLYEGVSTKILAFSSSNEDDMDYSGAERTENILVATEAFFEGNAESKMLGQGIGATAYYTENNVVMYLPAEEANNLYLSVMLNQGFIGLVLLLSIFFLVFKQTVSSAASMAFLAGIITQLLQYFIVGNLWLYFFWIYIFFIIVINRQRGASANLSEEMKQMDE